MTTAQPASWPHAMIALLERQQRMMDRLVELAQSQAGLIAAGHTNQLLDLLARRQSVIDEFTESQAELASLSQEMDQRLNSASQTDRDRIKSLINDIAEQLNQVMRRDEADQAMLRTNSDQIKQELSNLGTTRQARAAYRGGASPVARFADRQG